MQEPIVGQNDFRILVPGGILQLDLFPELITQERQLLILRLHFKGAQIADIIKTGVITLPLKDLDDGFYRLGLIALYFEIKLHRLSLFVAHQGLHSCFKVFTCTITEFLIMIMH